MAQITLTGQLLNGLDEPIVGEYVYFRVTGAGTDETNDAVYPRKTFTLGPSDSNGDLPSDAIWVNGDSGVQSYYEVRLPGQERVDIVIPSGTTGTIDLSTMLTDYRVNSSTQQNTVYTDAIDRTNHTGGPDDLNGNEIILDADGDTSITADTDDQIDFKIGGTDELTLTATKADNLDDFAALTPTDSNFIVGDGTDWVAESGATARESLGLTIGTDVQAYDPDLTQLATQGTYNANGLIIQSDNANVLIFNGAVATFVNGPDPSTWNNPTNRTALGLGASDDVSFGSLTIQNALTVEGGLSTPTTSVASTTYTAVVTDSILIVDDNTAGSAVTVTLPAAATAGDGFQIDIKKTGNTANVIVDGNGSETIDGATTATLTTQYESISLVCDGSSWHIT